MTANPFKPTAGKMPPILVGRQPILDDFVEGLENGAGAPGRLMFVTGQRGYGKTVLLTEMRRLAQARGWLAIADTASEGLCERLVGALADERGVRIDGASISPTVSIPGIASLSLGKASVTSPETAPLTLRRAMEKRLASKKIQKGTGILFTIDETQASSRDEMVAIATAVQHVIASEDQKDLPDSEKKGVAFVFAGLPSVVDDVVNDKVLTFLRRAMRRELTDIPLPDIRNAFVETVQDSGKTISDAVAERAADLTDGYPYMIQLIGYYMWQSAQRDHRDVITEEDVRRAEGDAVAAFGDAVCAPALHGLPDAAITLLKAVAKCGPGPVRTSSLIEATGKSRTWVNKYRNLLVAEKLLSPAAFGEVEIVVPHMREYLVRRGR